MRASGGEQTTPSQSACALLTFLVFERLVFDPARPQVLAAGLAAATHTGAEKDVDI